MPENLYPKLPSAPLINQESFNIETARKYYQDITDLRNKYNEKQRKYKNSYNRLLHASTGASSFALISGACFNYRHSIHHCRLTNKRIIRCCEHCFNLHWWNSVVIIKEVQEEIIKVLRAVR